MRLFLVFCIFMFFSQAVFAKNVINAVVKSDRAVIYADKEMSAPIGYLKKGKPLKIGNRASKHVPLIIGKRVVWTDRSDLILETDEGYDEEEWRHEQAQYRANDQNTSRSYRELVDNTLDSRISVSFKPIFDLQNLTRPLATDPTEGINGTQSEVWYETSVGEHPSTVGIGILSFKIQDPLMDFDFSGYAPGLKLNPLFVEIPIGIDITTPFSVFGFPENFKEKSGAKQKLLLLGASAGVQAEIFLSHIGIAFGGGIQYLRFSGFKNRDDSVSDMTRFNRGIYSRFAVGSLICRF